MKAQALFSLIETELYNTLKPVDYCIGYWRAGSSVTGRFDQYSDLDLKLLFKPGNRIKAIETVLNSISKVADIESYFCCKSEDNSNLQRVVVNLKGLNAFQNIDLCIYESENLIWETEVHGDPFIFFQKGARLFNRPKTLSKVILNLVRDLEDTHQCSQRFGIFVEKELKRGRIYDANLIYQENLTRLVRILRIKHTPYRYNVKRYAESELPLPEVKKLRELVLISSPEDLLEKNVFVLNKINEVYNEIQQHYQSDSCQKTQ